MSSIARGMIPLSRPSVTGAFPGNPNRCCPYANIVPRSPSIVYVFPVPVCPYANTVALYPRSAFSAAGFALLSYTSSCVALSSYTASNSNSYVFCLSYSSSSANVPPSRFPASARSPPALAAHAFPPRVAATAR